MRFRAFGALFTIILSSGMADAQTIYVSTVTDKVCEIVSGQVTQVFSSSLLSDPQGLAFDANGNLYVANDGRGSICRIDAQGTITTFVAGLTHPNGLAFDTSGNLYVSDDTLGTISKISPQGQVSLFARPFASGRGLAFDASGNLFMADFLAATIYRIDPHGTISAFQTGLNSPAGLAFDPSGNLYVSSYFGQTITEFSPTGMASVFASKLPGPIGLAFDQNGNLYAANSGSTNMSVSRITPSGNVSTWVSSLGGDPNYIVIAAPEPGSLPLLLACGVGLLKRRRTFDQCRSERNAGF